MIVTCPSCAARYKLNDNKVTGRGAKITCPKCRYVFVVYPSDSKSTTAAAPAAKPKPRPKAPVAAPARSTAAPSLAGRRSAEDLDFRKVGIASWKVRVKIGLVYDFSDIKTLRKYIQDGRVTSEDVISHDGKTWATIGDIPDLDAYFIKVYDEAKAAMDARSAEDGAQDFDDDDSPTMIVGMGSLGSDLAADALRQATAAATPTPHPVDAPSHSMESQFVDPFAALKSKQRDRSQSRRTTASVPPPPKSSSEVSNRSIALMAVVFIVLGLAVWYLANQPARTVSAPPPNNTPPTQQEPSAEDKARAAQEYQDRVDKILEEGEAEPLPEEPEEPELMVVVPPDARRGSNSTGSTQAPNSTGGNQPPPNGSGISNQNMNTVDHASVCRSSYQARNWGQAVIACGQATASASDPELIGYHGVALQSTGNSSQACSKLNQATRAGARNPELKKYLGHCSRDVGDVAGATQFYQQYIATNPPDRGSIEAALKQLTGS